MKHFVVGVVVSVVALAGGCKKKEDASAPPSPRAPHARAHPGSGSAKVDPPSEVGEYESVGDAKLAQVKRPADVRRLKLDAKDLTDAGMARLADYTGVKSVWLESNAVTKAGAAHLGSLAQLEELTVLRCAAMDDEGLEAIKGLKNLHTLDLVEGEPMTAKGSAALATLTGLRKLRIGHVGPDGLSGVAKLVNLEELDLNFSRCDDANLAYLAGLTKLRKLNLQYTKVTDAGMKHLGGLTGLRELTLMSDAITDEGVKSLAGLKGLTELGLGECKVTGGAFKDMAGMSGLNTLWLGGSPVTDANVMALKDLPALKEVTLTGTRVSEDAALELKRAKPALTVRDVSGSEVSLTPKPPRPRSPTEDLSKVTPAFALTADALMKELKGGGRAKYEGKVIEVSGEVSSYGRNFGGDPQLMLKAANDFLGLVCFTAEDEPWARAAPGQQVKLKGRLGQFGESLVSCVLTDLGTYAAIEVSAADLAKAFAADPKATSAKYDKKCVVVTGEVERKEFNSVGAAGIFLKTGVPMKVQVVFTAFENGLTKGVKVGQKFKAIAHYSPFGTDEVRLDFAMPITRP